MADQSTNLTANADRKQPSNGSATPPDSPDGSTPAHAATGTHGDAATTTGDVDNDDEGQKVSAEEFAAEHDPAQHDVAAGEELRQRGDWTADEAGGSQVWDAEGNLIEGTSPAVPTVDGEPSDESDDDAGNGGAVLGDERRTSSFDEVRDGGYSVGSAARIDDGAMPLGHPVKAWEDTKTFITPDHPGYADTEPDLWFTDADAAGRAEFRPAD